MKALLLIAHGSRREQANEEIAVLTQHLDQTDQSFDQISHCFLEMATPSIAEAAQSLIAVGATEIVFLPYFLAMGAHVARDIPEIVDQLQSDNPSVDFSIMKHIGYTEGMKRLLLMQIQQASFRKD